MRRCQVNRSQRAKQEQRTQSAGRSSKQYSKSKLFLSFFAMLAESSSRTKRTSTKEQKRRIPTHLLVEVMGGQLSLKAKKPMPNSIEESFSYSCSLVCNETLDSVTPKKECVKRSRKTKPEVQQQVPRKKLKISMLYEDYDTRNSYMAAFFKLLDDDTIQDFLWMDGCAKISDKYLLSMVYAYFRRASLQRREYNRLNFFTALYLANDMEEDEEDDKYDIFPWALGKSWRELYPNFLIRRDILWQKMKYRAVVSKQTCDEVMMIVPDHPIWWRERKSHHGGAWRSYTFTEDPSYSPRGPGSSPVICVKCKSDLLSLGDTPSTTSDYSSQSSTEESSSVACAF